MCQWSVINDAGVKKGKEASFEELRNCMRFLHIVTSGDIDKSGGSQPGWNGSKAEVSDLWRKIKWVYSAYLCLKQGKADFWAVHILRKEKWYLLGTDKEWLMGCNREKKGGGTVQKIFPDNKDSLSWGINYP